MQRCQTTGMWVALLAAREREPDQRVLLRITNATLTSSTASLRGRPRFFLAGGSLDVASSRGATGGTGS